MAVILTIDDSGFERRILGDLLRKEGYEVIEAESGEAGLETYSKEKPDVVLLDLRMPGISGSETLKRLIETDPSAKVIIVSIVRDQETMDDLVASGAKAYVKKPVTAEKLIPQIKKIMEDKK